ncbi:MAG TPA: hypothetical protein VG984_02565 [Candidatus Paceibacterota bacterium]|nr:hypothetical protein [Candidatus Paceibacterota bacterium]
MSDEDVVAPQQKPSPAVVLANDVDSEFEPLFHWHMRSKRGANLGLFLPGIMLCFLAAVLDDTLPSYSPVQFVLTFVIVTILGHISGGWLAERRGYRAARLHKLRLIRLIHRNLAVRAVVDHSWEGDKDRHTLARELIKLSDQYYARHKDRKSKKA